MLKIWGRANSINVQKVLWCCGELGLQYHRIDAGNEFGVTKTPEYRVLNPNGLVPTIEDGDFQLWESNVIVRYLAQKSPSGRLCPADIRVRFDAERWMDWQATVFWPVFRIAPFSPASPFPSGTFQPPRLFTGGTRWIFIIPNCSICSVGTTS